MIIEVTRKQAYGSDSYQLTDTNKARSFFSLTGRKGITRRDIENLQKFSPSKIQVHLSLGSNTYPLDTSVLPH